MRLDIVAMADPGRRGPWEELVMLGVTATVTSLA
jgi:hypothetical protein